MSQTSGQPQTSFDATGSRVALVVSRWHENVTRRLLDGAAEALVQNGSVPAGIFHCPGSFELPLAVQWAACSARFDAIVALGCLIRGETPHFECISQQTSAGLAQVMLDSGRPVGFGLLTVETLEQALDRAGGRYGNKGTEAVLAVLDMLRLRSELVR